MFKVWLAVGIAAVVAVIILVVGIANQSRFMVVLLRAIIAGTLLGCMGYALSVLFERIGLPYLLSKNVAEKEDASNGKGEERHESEEMVQENSNERAEAEFSPFTADRLNRVSPPGS